MRRNITAASLLAALVVGGGPMGVPGQSVSVAPTGHSFGSLGVVKPVGGTHSAPSGIVYGGEWGGGWTTNYPKRTRVSVAEGQRRARKHRNRLKARGQHRRAVR